MQLLRKKRFFVNQKLFKQINSFKVLEEVGSDHLPILIEVKLKDRLTTSTESDPKQNFNYRKANWNTFQKYINENVDKIDTEQNVESLNENITKIILSAAEKSIPVKNSIQYKKTTSKSYITIYQKTKILPSKIY